MSAGIFGRGTKAGRLAVAALVLASQTGQARAGFFEELFGLSEPKQAAPARPQVRQAPLHGSVEVHRRKSEAADGSATGSRPRKPALCYADETPASAPAAVKAYDRADALLHDETLRAGDTVVTADGVRVYEGRSAGCPHDRSDFVALSVSALPKAKRGALVDIERAIQTTRRDEDVVGAIAKPAPASAEAAAH